MAGILWAEIEQESVLKMFPPKHPIIPDRHHPGKLHVTLWYDVDHAVIEQWIGVEFIVNLYLERWDTEAHGVKAHWREGRIHELCQMAFPHCTISLAEKAKPQDTISTVSNFYSNTSRRHALDVPAVIQFHQWQESGELCNG